MEHSDLYVVSWNMLLTEIVPSTLHCKLGYTWNRSPLLLATEQLQWSN